MRFALQVTELLPRNRASVIYPEFFRAPFRKNYALDRKMIGTFLLTSTCSVTMLSFFWRGENRTTRAGCRCENMVMCSYVFFLPPGCLQRQTAGIKFTHRPKISIFVIVAQIHVKFNWHDQWACGFAWPHEISRQSVHGGGNSTVKWQNFHFLVKSRPAGANPLTDFCC